MTTKRRHPPSPAASKAPSLLPPVCVASRGLEGLCASVRDRALVHPPHIWSSTFGVWCVCVSKQVRGRTAGFQTPLFIVDLSGGGGKRDVHSAEWYVGRTHGGG